MSKRCCCAQTSVAESRVSGALQSGHESNCTEASVGEEHVERRKARASVDAVPQKNREARIAGPQRVAHLSVARCVSLCLFYCVHRELSRALGLPSWDEPASACLSSRIPYHSEVTEEKLRTIQAAEAVLQALGFRVFRVRHHDTIARRELGRDEMARALEPALAAEIDRALRALGYIHVAVDLRGYRLGSLNDALKLRPV